MAAAKFVLKASKDQFMFNLKAGNNEIILTSERYKQRKSAEAGIESVKKNAPDDARFERKTAKSGEPYYVLKAANGEIIGKSEMYSTATAMEKGIASVKKNAPKAAVSDETELKAETETETKPKAAAKPKTATKVKAAAKPKAAAKAKAKPKAAAKAKAETEPKK